jgi:hypothetical protein
MKEPILEPLLRKMRLAKVLPTIMQYHNCSLLDIGCGWEAKLLQTVKPHISSGIGIDFKAPDISESNWGGGSYEQCLLHLKKHFHLKTVVLMS